MNIVIVDDEREIADLVEVLLQQDGYHTHTFYDPVEALTYIDRATDTDLAILDVMMPLLDGFSLCAAIRRKHTYPVLMLTARTDDIDKIKGLGIGADDYITKPFNPLELLARVKAQLRRRLTYDTVRPSSADTIEIRGLTVNRVEHTVQLYNEPLSLTPTEFDILWLLCERCGSVVSSEEIFETVWKEAYLDSNNTVMVHIRRLREKLKEPSRAPRIIKTVWGVGYKIEK